MQQSFKIHQHLHTTILAQTHQHLLNMQQSMFIKTWVVGKMRHFTAGIMESIMADVLAGIPLHGWYICKLRVY
jgi:hypothetical protein